MKEGDTDMDEMNEFSLLRNGSGYVDPTAYEAIKSADAIESDDDKVVSAEEVEEWYGRRVTPEEYLKFKKTLGCIKRICELAGYRLEGRVTLVDVSTGKIWK